MPRNDTGARTPVTTGDDDTTGDIIDDGGAGGARGGGNDGAPPTDVPVLVPVPAEGVPGVATSVDGLAGNVADIAFRSAIR
jgi:hypothetical protein